MAEHDQCPSSKKAGKPGKAALAERRRPLQRASGGAGGPVLWRSLDEAADTPAFREFVEKEFPSGASELLETSRRGFLQVMGASIALAGAATIPGCRRPNHKIMPYSATVPEEVIPGKPLYYATSMPLPGGGAEGLLVETHEGRPTKIEGNPLHPINQGKCSIWALASILSLYDPDRAKFPIYYGPVGDGKSPREPKAATWDDYRAWHAGWIAEHEKDGGAGLAFLVEKKSSPTRDAVRDRVLKRFPRATWLSYAAAESYTPIRGSMSAYAVSTYPWPQRELLSLAYADVVVSFDRDFLQSAGGSEPRGLVHARDFASRRSPMSLNETMSRLYVVESSFTITGGQADHRVAAAPSRIGAYVVLLAKALRDAGLRMPDEIDNEIKLLETPDGPDLDTKFIAAVAKDLLADEHGRTRAGRTLIVAGPSQPAPVHVLVHAINEALGNAGRTVKRRLMSAEEAFDSASGFASLCERMKTGAIRSLVCIGVNPVYDSPPELDFASLYRRVTGVCLSVDENETAAASAWHLNSTHYLEQWGDTEAWDGTIAMVQPMIAPIYEPAMSDIEYIALFADTPAGVKAADYRPSGYDLVRRTWGAGEAPDFERFWRRALHNGVWEGQRPELAQANFHVPNAATAIAGFKVPEGPAAQKLDVVFTAERLHDGRFANIGWLQELPQVGTTVVWDNPALVSPKTAKALGIMPDDPTTKFPEGRVVTLTVGARTIDIPAWVMPGMADNTVVLPMGGGRTVCGLVGSGVGFNTFRLRDASASCVARGAGLKVTGRDYPISSTQNHWTVEGRTSILRHVDLAAWQKHGDKVDAAADRLYDTQRTLKFGERVGGGELTHTPAALSLYVNPFNETIGDPKPGAPYTLRPQWGMSIDLGRCTGCGACTIACQAENNIPIVGKKEVAKGREMTWIRVDRYFQSPSAGPASDKEGDQDWLEATGMVHQPVTCMHCENAPCETVCPVNATVHGPEGINYMTYNRCIGTRYCANNCPYKVRRFNFFEWGVAKFQGEYYGRETLEGLPVSLAPKNRNLIPPRLREKLDEIARMQKNPNVTVRSRGVMEKCSYCIQRINQARMECKLHDLKIEEKGTPSAGRTAIPDGFFQTACQQACPSEAIVFGDILDQTSRAYQRREHARTYALLAYLDTRPRTTYMVRLANPNPALRTPDDNPFHHAPGSHGPEGGGHAPEQPGGGAHSRAIPRSTFLRDGVKAAADRGYALSLRVLGLPGAGLAGVGA